MGIKVVLAQDQRLLREGIRLVIETDPELQVVGEAGDGYDCLKLIEQLRPDVAVVDIVMPRLNGIEAVRVISTSHPSVKTIILSLHADNEYIYRALQAGAKGFLLKESSGRDLVEAIHAVHRNSRCLSPQVTESIIMGYLKGTNQELSSPLENLSIREREVLQLVTEGKTSVQIARLLYLSPKTVETYRSRIMSKLNLHSTADLVKFALRHGLADCDPPGE
jgi:DNA-binding NarL/FixJ family response regulator